MSDFLTTLAARALGVAQTLQPRAALFEPTNPTAELDEVVASVAPQEPAIPVQLAQRQGTPQQRHEGASESPALPIQTATTPPILPNIATPPIRASQPAIDQTPAALREPATTLDRQASQPVDQLAVDGQAVAQHTQAQLKNQSPALASAQPPVSAPLPATSVATVRDMSVAQQRVSDAPAESPTAQPPVVRTAASIGVASRNELPALGRNAAAPPQPPSVSVTIGRIEVRAVQQVPAQRPAPIEPQPPALSLDDYMRQRETERS